MYTHWTKEEIDLLYEHYPTSDKKTLTTTINKSWSSINHKASRLSISRENLWGPEEEYILLENYEYTTREQLQLLLPKRTWSSIKDKAFQLGIKRVITERPVTVWNDARVSILNKYYSSMSRESLEDLLGLPWSSIESQSNILKLYREGKHQPLRSEVIMDFTVIDTPEKAYILGVLFSDGSMQYKKKKYIVKIGWKEADVSTLRKIRDMISPGRKLFFEKKRKPEHSNMYILAVTNKNLCEQLIPHGLFPNKVYTLRRPNIPKHLIPHFIRGYFDGDGSVQESKGDKLQISNLRVTVTGTEDIISFIDSYFRAEYLLDKNYVIPAHKSKHAYVLKLSGKKARLFLRMIYRNSTIHLNRKYIVAQRYLDLFYDARGNLLDVEDTPINIEEVTDEPDGGATKTRKSKKGS